MIDKIIVSGCSYSQKSGVENPYPNLLNIKSNIEVNNLSWPGQGNDTIIRNIKDQIRNGVTNTLFICQLTHLHRKSEYCTVNKQFLDFQPSIINVKPQIKNDKVSFDIAIGSGNHKLGTHGAQFKSDVNLSDEVYLELEKWYDVYLKYLYDEKNSFYQLMYEVELLDLLVEKTNNKIIYLYWPDIIYDDSYFKKYNFLSIDNQYSIIKWSIKNKYTFDYDTHLNLEGHNILCNNLLKKLKIKNKFYI